MQDLIRREIRESLEVKQQLLERLTADIETAAQTCLSALRAGGKLLFCGNGGSAADSQHLAAELIVRLRGHFERPSIPALALTVDSSILTAGGNDYGFQQIFARQIEGLGAQGDVLFAISTSGNSGNVIKAVECARGKGIKTIGLLGAGGGKLKPQVDLALVIPSKTTARIQEMHILIGHILCQLIEEALYADHPG